MDGTPNGKFLHNCAPGMPPPSQSVWLAVVRKRTKQLRGRHAISNLFRLDYSLRVWIQQQIPLLIYSLIYLSIHLFFHLIIFFSYNSLSRYLLYQLFICLFIYLPIYIFIHLYTDYCCVLTWPMTNRSKKTGKEIQCGWEKIVNNYDALIRLWALFHIPITYPFHVRQRNCINRPLQNKHTQISSNREREQRNSDITFKKHRNAIPFALIYLRQQWKLQISLHLPPWFSSFKRDIYP